MGIFAFLRIAFRTKRMLDQSKKQAKALGELPLPEFIPKWLEQMSSATDNTYPILRPPALASEIADAEQRLGMPLPDELKEFYTLCDGIDWSSASYREDFVRISELKPSCQHKPPLRMQLRKEWETWGRDDGLPEGLQVFSGNLLKLMADAHEFVLPFTDVDEMLALETPASGSGILIVTRPHRLLPRGTILEVENLSATLHDTIRSWLAESASTIAMSNTFLETARR